MFATMNEWLKKANCFDWVRLLLSYEDINLAWLEVLVIKVAKDVQWDEWHGEHREVLYLRLKRENQRMKRQKIATHAFRLSRGKVYWWSDKSHQIHPRRPWIMLKGEGYLSREVHIDRSSFFTGNRFCKASQPCLHHLCSLESWNPFTTLYPSFHRL